MKKLSKEVSIYKRRENDILKYFSKKGYSQGNVSEYSASSMLPLYVIYYYLNKNEISPCETNDNMLRLCKFYEVDVDIYDRIDYEWE